MISVYKFKLNNVLLLFASVFISLVTAEIVLRAFSSDNYYAWPPGLKRILKPIPEIMLGIHGESLFRINSYGLTGEPFSQDQAYRILTVGGSTTHCIYLDDTETWPYLLQENLNASLKQACRVEMLLKQYPKINAVILLVGVNDFLTIFAAREKPPSGAG